MAMRSAVDADDLAALSTVLLLSPDASPDAKLPAASGPESSVDAEALPLVDLLVRASETIRAERARADALEEENTELRAQLDGVRVAYRRALAHGSQRSTHVSGGAAAAAAAAALSTAGDELHAYVRAVLLRSVDGVTPAGTVGDDARDDGRRSLSRQRDGRRSSSATGASSAASVNAHPPSRGSVTATTQSYTKGWDAVAAAAVPHTHETGSGAPSSPSPPPLAASHRPPATPPAEHTTPTNTNGLTSAAATPELAPAVRSMAARLRRALAPRPPNHLVSDVVHAMVVALQRDLQVRLDAPPDGRTAAVAPTARSILFIRLQPCVYRLLFGGTADVAAVAHTAAVRHHTGNARPAAAPHRSHFLLYGAAADSVTGAPSPQHPVRAVVLHLAIDSGALRAVRGGGHVDLIHYLERRLGIRL